MLSLCFLVSTGPNTFILRAQSACHVLLNYAWVCVCYVNHDLSFYNIIKAFGSREPFKKGLYIWFGPCSRSTINVLPCMRKQFFFWTMFKKTSGRICYFLLYDRVIKYALYWKVICGFFRFTCEIKNFLVKMLGKKICFVFDLGKFLCVLECF